MPSKITATLAVACFSIILSSSMTLAATIRVPSEYPTIQAGIDASEKGDTVLVADGTYTGTGNKDLDYGGKAITVLSEHGQRHTVIDCENSGRGCYFGSGQNHTSVLDGFTIRNGSASDGGGLKCYRSSPSITNCTLIGNTADNMGGGFSCCKDSSPSVTNCRLTWNISADGSGGGLYCSESSLNIMNCVINENEAMGNYEDGGGICCFNSSAIIEKCVITGNISADDGGGVYCSDSSHPTITNCWVTGNVANYSGGGIYCRNSSPTIIDSWILLNDAGNTGGGIGFYSSSSLPLTILNCSIYSNTARFAGGVKLWSADGEITNCMIFNNVTDESAGGICCTTSSPNITNCIVTLNTANENCGGIFLDHSIPTIKNCWITDNVATENGGGLYLKSSSPVIKNCTVAGNRSIETYGGGFYCYRSSPVITNCTITGNAAHYSGGGLYYKDNSSPIITNCILWNNSPGEVSPHSGGSYKPSISYSDVQGGWEGRGNIDADPLFIDPESGDYGLQPGSPCIDAGDPYSKLDLDESINDMGSFGGLGDWPEGVIGGSISGVLSKSGSPYVVSENLVIESDSILTIEPGVELLLHNHSGIVVFGELIAEGTEDDLITVTRFLEWDVAKGIKFDAGGGSLSYCRIEACSTNCGGGICCYRSSPAISNCSISGNTANYGGGIYCNESSPAVRDCLISENSSNFYGGGIYCRESSNLLVENSMIRDNIAADRGGGIYGYDTAPSIENCTLTGNSAENGGGLYISNATVTNCTITYNEASEYGGGFYCYSYSTPKIINCTLTGNISDFHGGGICCLLSTPIITNCILWNDSPEEVYVRSGDPIIEFSDIQGGWYGEGNICADPLLREPGDDDYHLKAGSPCIDSGTLDGAPEKDFEGDLRPIGSSVDMGVDEYSGNIWLMNKMK